MSPPLNKWAIGGVLIVCLSIALAGLIDGTLSLHGNKQVDTGELGELNKLQNATSLTQTAQERSESAEARTQFFSLPGVINTFRTVFQSIPIWEIFIGTSIEILGLHKATQNWPQILAVSSLMILISYKFVMRIR